MRHNQKWHANRWMIAILMMIVMATGLLLAACATNQAPPEEKSPAKVEPIKGSDFSRVILTDEAIKRLDIQTTQIKDRQVRGEQRKVVPYSAVLYGQNGEAWVYINPEHNTYQRETITVDFIEDDLAVLSKGPNSGTVIVTVGGPELFGAETGVGE